MRAAKRDRGRDCRMLQQNFIDFMRRDVFASTDDDVLDASREMQVTIVVQIALVSGAKPSIDEGAGVSFRITLVSAKYICPLNRNFSALIVFERITLLVHNSDAQSGAHSNRSDLAMARRQRV